MTPERAREIIADAQGIQSYGPWSDNLPKVMRPGERAEVVSVWKTMHGSACFVDALNRIARGTR